MAVPPLIAAKAAGTAQKALTGDIYTRKWTEIVGKGKKAKVVEHEFRVNPVGLGLGAVAVGGAALTATVALWWAQLKLRPSLTTTYKTVVDVAEIPAYNERVPIPEVGHWADNVVVVGKMDPIWIGDTYIRGVLRPGHWITPDKVQTVPGQHWVVDVAAGYDIIPHAAIPAVTHQEETGRKKSFHIEERKPFSFSDVADSLNPLGSFGKQPIFGDWSKGDFFAKKRG